MYLSSSFSSINSKLSLFKNVNKANNLIQKSLNLKIKRTFLTDNYYCYEKWDEYLLTDVLKSVKSVNEYSIKLTQNLTNKNIVTPLDMDILASKLGYISNYQELEYIESIFENFRKTQPSLYTREGMHYGFIRSYIDINQADRVLQILKLKFKYGIFICPYTANMLMDTYVKKKDYEKAALTAHEVMLQENNENPLTLAACLVSCMNYLKELKEGKIELPKPAESDQQDEQKKKLLVYFLRKPFNDMHFDLTDQVQLSGKTIYFASLYAQNMEPVLNNSLKIYGLSLLKKYDKLAREFEDIFVKNQGKLYKFAVDELNSAFSSLSANEEEAKKHEKELEKWKSFSALIQSDNGRQIETKNINIIEELDKYLEETKKKQINLDIESQTKLLEDWSKNHKIDLEEQIHIFTMQFKKEEIMKRLDNLERQEEVLTFFDRRDKIINKYYGKGFPNEIPSRIPIEADEAAYKVRFDRHFKTWPKYKNRPIERMTKAKEYELASLKQIYLNNQKVQTIPDAKLKTKAQRQ